MIENDYKHYQNTFLQFLLCLFLLSGCTTHNVQYVPLPQLPLGAINLRVAYVINPRLPRMSSEQLQRLLLATQIASQQHFGVTLKFLPVEEIPISTFFLQIPDDRRKQAQDAIFDFKTGKGDVGRLNKDFAEGLKEWSAPLPEIEQFARPYIGELKEHNFDALGTALAKLQLNRIEHWKNIKALDGDSIIDTSPYNEFTMWVALGYGDIPFEVVITNQPLVSVEYVHPAVHTAIRGGYSNGVTTYNKLSHYGTMSIWSTFAFTTDDAWVKEMRDGESYSAEDAATFAGISMAHEIGHQLFHYGHPLNHSACIMNPISLFSYRAWAEKLSAKDCPVGSNPAMQPGAARLAF
ncbi:MAG TPA: hypothetical protein VIF82_18250 [Burkholderiaceae bacterium]